LTASAFEEERQQVLAQGADNFIRKPFKHNDLLLLIGRHLGLTFEYAENTDSAVAAQPLTANDNEHEQQPAATDNTTAQTPAKVLIVDDVQVNRMLLKKIMSNEGYHCKEANNGREALAALQSWQPDVMLLDVQMPIMDGYEVLRSIKSQASPVLTIAVTANNDKDEVLKLKYLGAIAVCDKPIVPEQIKDVVKRYISPP